MSNKQGLPLITEIQPISQQIGTHILSALQRADDAVAVLTSIIPNVGLDRVVSMPISRAQFVQIQAFLQQSQLEEHPEEEEQRAIGFEIPKPQQEED